MNKPLKIGFAMLFAGASTLAGAQQSSPTTFADEFAFLQSSSGSSSSQNWHPAPKTFSRASEDPATPLTESQMQYLSDDRDPSYRPDHGRPPPSAGPTFAQQNPKGLPFSYYEAASSNSGEWKSPGSAGRPAYATVGGATPVATNTVPPSANSIASN